MVNVDKLNFVEFPLDETTMSTMDIPPYRRVPRRRVRTAGIVSADIPPYRRIRRRVSRKMASADIEGLGFVDLNDSGDYPIDMAEGTGVLSIDTSPESLEVTVDGKYYGLSPINVLNIDQGQHTVQVMEPGKRYRQPYVMSVNVLDDTVHYITVDY